MCLAWHFYNRHICINCKLIQLRKMYQRVFHPLKPEDETFELSGHTFILQMTALRHKPEELEYTEVQSDSSNTIFTVI